MKVYYSLLNVKKDFGAAGAVHVAAPAAVLFCCTRGYKRHSSMGCKWIILGFCSGSCRCFVLLYKRIRDIPPWGVNGLSWDSVAAAAAVLF